MIDPDLLASLKALADASRLRLLGLLAAGPRSLQQLSRDLDLAPGTVVHHLERLRAAGLVDGTSRQPNAEYSLRLERLHELGRSLDRLERAAEPAAPVIDVDLGDVTREEARVLRGFVVDGRLASIPAQGKKRQVILRYALARCFAEDRDYPEREVNERLAELHPDTASLRRHLVEAGLMTRDRGVYRRGDTPAAG